MASEKFRVIYDCNIFWRAFFSPLGIGGQCKKLVDARAVHHFTSRAIIEEIKSVLLRPRTLSVFGESTPEKVERLVEDILRSSILIKRVPPHIDFERDAKDVPYLNLAIEVGADFIVTTDNDLLDLMTGIDDVSKEFRQRFRKLKIVHPQEFLRLMSVRDLAIEP
jgi:putative PIN family toxin of toxin-antitoxin system